MMQQSGSTPFLQQGSLKKLFYENPQQQHEPGSLLDLSANAAGKNTLLQKENIKLLLHFLLRGYLN